jgi:hypothetical protein
MHTVRREIYSLNGDCNEPNLRRKFVIHFRPVDDESQLIDALTGAVLREGASKCLRCGVFYNLESVVELESSNDGNCASCGPPFHAGEKACARSL